MIRIITVLLLLSCIPAAAQSKKELAADKKRLEEELQKLKTQMDELKKAETVNFNDTVSKASYAVAVLLGSNIKAQGFEDLNVDAFVRGIKDVYNDSLQLDKSESQMFVQQYVQSAMERKSKMARQEGETFLAQNKNAEGVQVTPSGLQYKVIKEGAGKSPKATDNVTVHYTGKLIDGTVFDSSVERGSPATFGVSQVIAGWTEALQLMKEGGKMMLYIPYDLAYGERGAGGQIPPYAALIFEVELLKVN